MRIKKIDFPVLNSHFKGIELNQNYHRNDDHVNQINNHVKRIFTLLKETELIDKSRDDIKNFSHKLGDFMVMINLINHKNNTIQLKLIYKLREKWVDISDSYQTLKINGFELKCEWMSMATKISKTLVKLPQ